ncbi:MAG: hypothetical protein QOI86_3544 [Actinomycetota bacterium]|nr:hypothetical protein [Actinomycetota bacterium]
MNPQMVMLDVDSPDVSTVGPPVYANIAHVSYTPYDFRLTFSVLPTPHDHRNSVIAAPPRAVVDVVLPIGTVEAMVDLLRAEFDRFVEEFGSPTPRVQPADGQR